MAKITIEELYRGDKYSIMGAVTAKALTLGIDERSEDGRTWIEMELVRQTIVATLKLNQNDPIKNSEMRSPFLLRTKLWARKMESTANWVSLC